MPVAVLRIMGMEANLNKTKVMVCTPGFVWGEWGETEYKRLETAEGATFRQQKKMWVSCTVCGVTVVASYLETYMA